MYSLVLLLVRGSAIEIVVYNVCYDLCGLDPLFYFYFIFLLENF